MNFYKQLNWNNWKNLTDDDKRFLFEQVLMYFVSPLIKISEVDLVDFELAGIKCRTFELQLNEEAFVFIPGNDEAILGWDAGSQGIFRHELLKILNQSGLTELPEELEVNYNFSDVHSIDCFINDWTSDLRKVAIPPMIVQKYAVPAGTTYKGMLQAVSGDFSGDQSFFDYYEIAIQKQLYPFLTEEESLAWQQPKSYLLPEKFYFELLNKTDTYYLFQHQASTYEQIKKSIHKLGFDLLTQDQWEYCVGAGTRRLFRWGNELDLSDTFLNRKLLKKVTDPNMFGLVFPTEQTRLELTDDSSCCKLAIQAPSIVPIVNALPLSSYYQGPVVDLAGEILAPETYLYRKSIRIEG